MVAKEGKNHVAYTPHAAKHDERCALCVYFLSTQSQCRRVAGAISSKGWCELFKSSNQENNVMTRHNQPSHLQRFSGGSDFMNPTAVRDDYESLRKRDAEARRQRTYSHPSTIKLREQMAGPPPATPEATMMNRHADERGQMNTRQRQESERLVNRQNTERGKHLMVSRPLPGGFQEKTEREYAELHADHQRERDAMEHRQMQERDRMRRVK